MVRADAPRPRARRQGSQLSQAGPRLELPRALRGARRDPARPRADLPPGARLPLPLLPRPDDLPRGRPDGRGDPLERHVQGDRRRLGRPAHVQPLREAFDRHPERVVLRLEPRPARRGPRRARSRRTAGRDRFLLGRRVVAVRGLLLRGGQRRLAREAAGRLRRPGQRLRHLGPEERPDRQPRTPRTTSPGSRTSGSSTATAWTSSTPSARCARRSRTCARAPGRAIVHAPLRPDPLPLQLRPAGALPHARGARRGARRRPAAPLPQAAFRHRPRARGGPRARSRPRTSACTRKPPTARARRPSRTPRRSTTTSGPSRGAPSASRAGCRMARARRRRSSTRSTRR